GEVMANVGGIFREYRRNHPGAHVSIGDPGFILRRNPDRVRAPDLAYFAPGRLPKRTGRTKGYLETMPDLVVEIVSPSDRVGQVREKVAEWLTAGVRAVWVLYPASRRLVAHHLDTAPRTYAEEETLIDEAVLPGFGCRVAEFFE